MNHYVVLEAVKGNRALIHDPIGASSWMKFSDVSDHYTGVALELRIAAEFRTFEKPETLKLKHLWSRMHGIKRALAQVLVLSIMLQAFVLISPYYMQLAVDQALPSSDSSLLAVLALGFGLFTAINAGVSLLRSFVLVVAGTTVGFGLASNIARRLYRLPIDWFEKRQSGDILSRFQSVFPVRDLLTQSGVAALIDGLMAILTLVVMLLYSVKLAAITLTAFFTYLLIRVLSFSREQDAQAESIIHHGREQTIMIETLRAMPSVRLLGREDTRHSLWQTQYADAVNADVRLSRVHIWQNTANLLIFGLENVVVIWLSIDAVMRADGFTLGMVYAYLAYKTQFTERARALIDQYILFKMIRLHLERISDIALTDEDTSFSVRGGVDNNNELLGKIELKGVSYRYSSSESLVLSDVNFLAMPGDHIAITGPSGGGKSTLVKILLGLVEPESGVVLVDTLPLAMFGYRSYRRQIAGVLQDDNLFGGTLADNIALFDEDADMERIITAATAASIHQDIWMMPMRYDTLVGDMGSTLSGGQKQRVLLARALYSRPKILIIDEGTSHLDAYHEAEVNAAISSMGITRIVIAHRNETIEAAERIWIMEAGVLRPSG